MLTADAVASQNGMALDEVERLIELAKRSLVPERQRIAVIEDQVERYPVVTRNGVGPLDTKIGKFHHFDFSLSNDPWIKYSVIYSGELNDKFRPIFRSEDEPLRLRIDSGCETGQMFGDVTCECRQQLDEALSRISTDGGMVINIPTQDGRGFGLPHKLATLRLQTDLKVDTVQAGDLLVPDGSKDVRTYSGVVAILKFLGIEPGRTIKLMSNNYKKKNAFTENGYPVIEDPLVIEPTEHTLRHLKAKQEQLGHRGLIEDVD